MESILYSIVGNLRTGNLPKEIGGEMVGHCWDSEGYQTGLGVVGCRGDFLWERIGAPRFSLDGFLFYRRCRSAPQLSRAPHSGTNTLQWQADEDLGALRAFRVDIVFNESGSLNF
jgi:hypothetical protein